MRYIEYVNQLIGEATAKTENLVLFGQNIAAGSHLSGLTKGLSVGKGGKIINTTNSETSQTGMGFGLMLQGVPSIFFVKQLDFLLLGVDHLLNTYNFIRQQKPKTSFTIVPIMSDLGYHGVQSSFNNLGDICSLARVPGFSITNSFDAKAIISNHLVAPGFRIITVGQRLFGTEILEVEAEKSAGDQSLFQYSTGEAVTIVCFNLSFPYGVELQKCLEDRGLSSSLFSVNGYTSLDWKLITEDVQKTKKLVIIDDSKSANVSADNLLVEVLSTSPQVLVTKVRHDLPFNGTWLSPNPDTLDIDYEALADKLATGV